MTGTHFAAGQHRTVIAVLPVSPVLAHQLVTDVVATSAHSDELLEVRWVQRADPGLVTVGDRFTSSKRLMGMTWTSTATVTTADPGGCFAFAVSGIEHPTATWTFDLSPAPQSGTTLRYTVVLGDGPSMFDAVSGDDPARRAAAVAHRLTSLADDMQYLLDRLRTQADLGDGAGQGWAS